MTGDAAADPLCVQRAGTATLVLLAARTPGATVCPSEVARKLAADGVNGLQARDWRALMPAVHAAVDDLTNAGKVWLSWKGAPLSARTGPYRIAARIERQRGPGPQDGDQE